MLDTFVIFSGPDRSELMTALFNEGQEQQIICFKGVLLTGEDEPAAMYDSLSSVMHGREKMRLEMRIYGLKRRSYDDWIIYGKEIIVEALEESTLPKRKYKNVNNGEFSTKTLTGSFSMR